MFKRYLLCLIYFWATISFADQSETVSSKPETDAAQARALLEIAVARYRSDGEPVLAEISRQGTFTANGYYLYVVNTKGIMLASGGPSVMYIGRDISPLLSDDLKEAFAQALTTPEGDALLSREYRWMNWHDGKVERKRVYYQRVGDKIFAAGYYLPRSTPAEAVRLLNDAVNALSMDEKATLGKINKLDAFFNRDDLYVFVLDASNMQFIAHGADHRLVGSSADTLRSANGELIGPKIKKAIEGKEQSHVEYQWRNPVTESKELKHTLLKRVGGNIVAVGYYSKLE